MAFTVRVRSDLEYSFGKHRQHKTLNSHLPFFTKRNVWWYDQSSKRWRDGLHDAIWYKNSQSDVQNGWDGVLDYGWENCATASAIVGMGGVHDNGREDRRFWFQTAVPNRRASGNCQWTPYINDWDKEMNHQIASNQFISKIYSYQDNHREDRRWRLCLCDTN